MDNDLKNDSEKVVRTSWVDTGRNMTRRSILKWSLIGGLAIMPFAMRFILSKKTLAQEQPAETQITFSGPFNIDEVILPAVAPNIIEITGKDIIAESLTIYEGTYSNKIFISFTFQGKEDVNRKLHIFLYVLDDKGNIIAEKRGGIFTDPRISARESLKNYGKITRPSATIHVEIKKDVKISSISKIRLISLQDLED